MSMFMVYLFFLIEICDNWNLDIIIVYFLYSRIHVVYKGVYIGISVSSGGRAVGCQSCIANYFLSFSQILMKFGTDVCLGV